MPLAPVTPLTAFTTIATTALGVAGRLSSSRAQQQASNFNAALAEQQTARARQTARREAADFERRGRQLVSRGRALRAGSGIAPTGTPLLVDLATQDEVARNVQIILEGGQAKAAALENQAQLDRLRGRQARTRGLLGAGTTLLTGFNRAFG